MPFPTMKEIPYYSRDVDFDSLAKHDPEFAKISQQGKRNGFINFQDAKIVQYCPIHPLYLSIQGNFTDLDD